MLYFDLEYINSKKDEDLSPDPRTPRDQTIECDIQPTDTLSNLSLKYNIPLAELKRVNNIMKVCETCLFIYISNIIIFLIILKSTNAYLTLGKKYQLDWWSLKQILDIFDTIYKTNDNWYNYCIFYKIFFQDSEFFALKRIRIPVKPSSFLRELIPGVHSETNRNVDEYNEYCF